LLNGGFVHDLAGRLARRVVQAVEQSEPLSATGEARELRIVQLYRIALQRDPEVAELRELQSGLDQLVREWQQSAGTGGAAGAGGAGDQSVLPTSAEFEGFRNLCHAVLNSAAFVMVD
jgi:hypothetical protein